MFINENNIQKIIIDAAETFAKFNSCKIIEKFVRFFLLFGASL